jgi:hypothetical protein
MGRAFVFLKPLLSHLVYRKKGGKFTCLFQSLQSSKFFSQPEQSIAWKRIMAYQSTAKKETAKSKSKRQNEERFSADATRETILKHFYIRDTGTGTFYSKFSVFGGK